MPKLSQIVTPDVAEFTIEKHGVTATYRPGIITPATQGSLMDLMDGNRELVAFAKLLSKSLISWDLTDDDGKPYPLTEEALQELPGHFLADVVNTFFAQQRPNEEKSKTSGGSF